jgi:hypothetical protein
MFMSLTNASNNHSSEIATQRVNSLPMAINIFVLPEAGLGGGRAVYSN